MTIHVHPLSRGKPSLGRPMKTVHIGTPHDAGGLLWKVFFLIEPFEPSNLAVWGTWDQGPASLILGRRLIAYHPWWPVVQERCYMSRRINGILRSSRCLAPCCMRWLRAKINRNISAAAVDTCVTDVCVHSFFGFAHSVYLLRDWWCKLSYVFVCVCVCTCTLVFDKYPMSLKKCRIDVLL